MTRPNWLTGTNLRWAIVAAVVLLLVGIRVVRFASHRHRRPALGSRAGRTTTPAGRALIAPLAEGSVVEGCTLRRVATDQGGGLDLSFVKEGRPVGVTVVLADPAGPSAPVRVPPYVVYYSAHGDLAPVGFALARAVGAAIRPNAALPVASDFRP